MIKRLVPLLVMTMVFTGCSFFGASPQQNKNSISGNVNSNSEMNTNSIDKNENLNSSVPDDPSIQAGITILSPNANDVITSPVTLRGFINGDGWTAFEGQVGTVNLLDGNGRSLVISPLQATTERMTLPVNFETKLNFPAPQTETGLLVFSNENTSGMDENAREYKLPVRFAAVEERTSIKLFFNNDKLDPEISCDKVFEVVREVQKTPTIAHTTLMQLFNGPTKEEKNDGYQSFFSILTKDILKSIKIANNTAYVDLTDIRTLIPNASSSCGSAQLLGQIDQTLGQFPSIEKVIIAINGDPQTFYDWIQVGCNAENNNCDKTPFGG